MRTVLAVAGLVLAFAPAAQATISGDPHAYGQAASDGLANMKIAEHLSEGPPIVYDRSGDWTVTYGGDSSTGYGSLEVTGGSVLTYNTGLGFVGGAAYGRGTMLVTGANSKVQVSTATQVRMEYGGLTIESGGWVNFADTSNLRMRTQSSFVNAADPNNSILVTGTNSKLTHLGAQMNLGGDFYKADPAIEAENILTIADGGLVQTKSLNMSYDAEGGDHARGHVHMGGGGVLAIFGDKTGGTQATQFAPGGLFTGDLGLIMYHNGTTWENMSGAILNTDYDLTYHSSSFIVNGQELNGYTVLTMPYAVTYDGNGHNDGTPPTAQSKWYGVALTLASDIGTLEKTGYTFTGWNTAADGTGDDYALGASYTVNAAVTLFAQWVVASAFAITEVEYDPAAVPNPTVTLTWHLRPGTTYKAFSTLDLIDWSNELADSLGAADDEIPDDGNHITVTFPLTDGLEDEPDVFFRIQEE